MASNSILNKAELYARELLNRLVLEKRVYHNLMHTLDVVKVSNEIALYEGVSFEDLEIIQIAAWFHDTGYIYCCEGHEKHSSIYALNFLKGEYYPEESIEKVIACINATKVPQSPKSKIEEILCDADLHHLGLNDSYEKGELLRLEIKKNGIKDFSDIEWLKVSLQFLKSHNYFTGFAKHKYSGQKEKNILILEKKIEKLEREKKEIKTRSY